MADKGTVVLTEETFGSMKKIKFGWTAGMTGESGLVSKATINSYNGEIQRLVTVPNVAPDAPSSYNLTVLDEDGYDVLMGAGAARSATATEQVLASSLGVVANDKLAIGITGANYGKKGTAIIYIR